MAKVRYDLQNVDRVVLPVVPVFNWSVGAYMDGFFNGLKEGKFLGTKCPGCGRTYLPPRMVCERCFEKIDDLFEVPSTGTLESYTLAKVSLADDGEFADLDEPKLIGMVKHDGADTCIVARIEGVPADEVKVGMRLKAVLDSSAENVLEILSHYVPEK